MGQTENHEVYLAISGDKLQLGVFSWHIIVSLQKFCLAKFSFPWGILEASSVYERAHSTCTTQAICAYEGGLMRLSKLDLLHVPAKHNESDISRSFILWYLCCVRHKHSISAWGFADRKVVTLVLLSIKLSACQGVDPGRKYWPRTVLG